MTESQLLEALRKALTRTGADGKTLGEFATAMNCCTEMARRAVRKFIGTGEMETARGYRKAMDGTMRPVPVYRPVAKKKR